MKFGSSATKVIRINRKEPPPKKKKWGALGPCLFVVDAWLTSQKQAPPNIQGGPEKTAQTLMRYNLSTSGHRVTRFPAKCSETNW